MVLGAHKKLSFAEIIHPAVAYIGKSELTAVRKRRRHRGTGSVPETVHRFVRPRYKRLQFLVGAARIIIPEIIHSAG